MAIAGKVAITPKGNWSSGTSYQKLDLVYYNNGSYVAIQPSTGVIPTDESHWMLVVQSAGGADFEGIINGDIPVGNAKTLDGHEAGYFAPKAELAKYLPLTGGDINGNVKVASTDAVGRYIAAKNSLRTISLGVRANGSAYLYDDTNSLSILELPLDKGGARTFNGTASGNLPLTGGTLTKGSVLSFEKQNDSTLSGNLGIGFLGDVFMLWERGGTNRGIKLDLTECSVSNGSKFLHTGNITDYVAADSEVGTFTLKESGVTLGTGTYYKVGKMVHCRATGNLQQAVSTGYHSLTGLPFANASQNASVVDFHTHQYYGKASDNIVFDVGASEITINATSAISQGQPFTFSAIYFTE